MPPINLFSYQQEAIDRLNSGSILCGSVGSGKSMTSIAYYYTIECGGTIQGDGFLIPPEVFIPLYIITTARKRDTKEWESEFEKFDLSNVTVDSWNNLHKYENVKGAMFLFDEQRVVGSGLWVKSFIKISKSNRWLLLSATPGDTWSDYIPVFVANGFYRNRTDFLRQHAVYNQYVKFPKIDRYVETGRLEALRRRITVVMDYQHEIGKHYTDIIVPYDRKAFTQVAIDRWNPYDNSPILDISGCCYLMRRVVNSDRSRIEAIRKLMQKHPKIIVFYNFDYELELLRLLSSEYTVAEWNGHRHEVIPNTDSWIYLVQYAAGAEGWNCISTNVVVFYSLNYSYKLMTQAAGRIDRLNTPFQDLYYYTIKSSSSIDVGITGTLKNKRNFNEVSFFERNHSR